MSLTTVRGPGVNEPSSPSGSSLVLVLPAPPVPRRRQGQDLPLLSLSFWRSGDGGPPDPEHRRGETSQSSSGSVRPRDTP